jgi:hypothetical protein
VQEGLQNFFIGGNGCLGLGKKNLQLLPDIREPAGMFQQARESILATGEALPTFQ